MLAGNETVCRVICRQIHRGHPLSGTASIGPQFALFSWSFPLLPSERRATNAVEPKHASARCDDARCRVCLVRREHCRRGQENAAAERRLAAGARNQRRPGRHGDRSGHHGPGHRRGQRSHEHGRAGRNDSPRHVLSRRSEAGRGGTSDGRKPGAAARRARQHTASGGHRLAGGPGRKKPRRAAQRRGARSCVVSGGADSPARGRRPARQG